ncbi:MAG: creatininase family protein [Cyanophyceae cyanobacterium]
MSSLEFSQLDGEKTIAVMPVGAVEQHGPHLPVVVDACLLDGILERAIALMPEDLPVTILPTLAIGKSNEHSRYPGTLTLSTETLMQMWLEIGACVAAAGVRKLVLFNSHGGQTSLIDIVGRELRIKHKMLVVSSSWFALGLPKGLFDENEIQHGIHGGAIETSMMLKLAPELVQMKQAQDFHSFTQDLAEESSRVSLSSGGKLAWQTQDLNPLGACGNALNADAQKGEKLIDHAARSLIELLQDLERLPLSVLDREPAW